MLNNKSQIKRRARRFFTQRACFSAVADCTSTISVSLKGDNPAGNTEDLLWLGRCCRYDKDDPQTGARMDNGLQKIIEMYIGRWKFRIRIRHWPQRCPVHPRYICFFLTHLSLKSWRFLKLWPSLEVHHWATILKFLTTIWFLQHMTMTEAAIQSNDVS